MLTLILLAVLGGGLGLLAVTLAERQPATVRERNRRGDDTESEEPTIVFEAPERSSTEAPTPASTPAPAPPAPPPPPAAPAPRPESPEPGRPPEPGPPPRRRPATRAAGLRRVLRRPAGVRRSQAAVEGEFGDVGVASIPRRLLALVGLILVVVSVGVLVAVVVGAAVGAAVEVFDQTFR